MSRTRWPRMQAVIGVACGLLLMSACGVPLQTGAEPLPSNVLPAPLPVPAPPVASSEAAPSQQSTASPEAPLSRLRLWFVQDDGLAAVESALPVGSTPDLVLQTLAIGPTPEQAAEGLRTVARDPLTGEPLVRVAASSPSATALATTSPVPSPAVAPASVTVLLSSAFSALPPTEQVILLGQVVLSLAGSGERSIAFADDSGSSVAVPLPDGRLLDQPATARDFASLIVRP